MRHGTTSCTTSHNLTTVAPVRYLSSAFQTTVLHLHSECRRWEQTCGSICRGKCLYIEWKVILPSFRMHTGKYEEDKLQKRTRQVSCRAGAVISHCRARFAVRDLDFFFHFLAVNLFTEACTCQKYRWDEAFLTHNKIWLPLFSIQKLRLWSASKQVSYKVSWQ